MTDLIFFFRRHENQTKTQFRVIDSNNDVLCFKEIDLPYPKGHEFWEEPQSSLWVKSKGLSLMFENGLEEYAR